MTSNHKLILDNNWQFYVNVTIFLLYKSCILEILFLI